MRNLRSSQEQASKNCSKSALDRGRRDGCLLTENLAMPGLSNQRESGSAAPLVKTDISALVGALMRVSLLRRLRDAFAHSVEAVVNA